MRTYKNFTEAYVDLLREVYHRPEWKCAPRGMKIRESLGVQFKITNPRDRIPYVKDRNFSIAYMIAELLWYLSGADSTEWIAEYSKFWRNISDNGVTANSAYGARLFKPHQYHFAPAPRDCTNSYDNMMPMGWTQWKYLVNELVSDEDTRRAVVHIRLPQDGALAALDVPCTLTLQFFLRDNKVHLVTAMRSTDLILGLAYDVPAFTIFQELLAQELTKRLDRPIGLGDYIHTSNSLHIYERHFEMVEKILKNSTVPGPSQDGLAMPPLPPNVSENVMRLLMYEGQLRTADSPKAIEMMSNTLCEVVGVNMDPFWEDWADVLTSHWLRKMGDKKLARGFLNGVDFKGYSFFNK